VSTTAPTSKRSYNSTRRAQQAAQTRADVVAAAISRFRDHGWAATTLAAIADDAGVSVETIRNGFGSKVGLLRAAMDVAVAGDAEDVPLAERPEFAALAEGTLDERIDRVTELVADIHERSAGVWRAVVEAASADPELDRWRLETERGRRTDVGRGASMVIGRALDDDLVTVLWLLFGPESYQKLVVDEGRSIEEYRRLLADVMHRLAAASG
jgi:AcrR family transcriptional regulator